MIQDICPYCEKVSKLEFIKRRDTIKVRGESIEVEDQFFRCMKCGNEFEQPQSTHDVLDLAYREYRRRHNMLQPEDIRALRKKYNFTQKELANLLSWGEATLSRYEQGQLQSDAHEKILRVLMEPHNLLNLIENNPIFSEEKRSTLIKELQEELNQHYSFDRILNDKFGHYMPDQFSGNQKLDIHKLLACICFFCEGTGQFVTKINKLLFYADFKHFKEQSISITGSRYARITYGPVPDNYQYYIAFLKEKQIITIIEEFFDEKVFEKIITNKKPDLSIFNDSEIEVLLDVKKYFKNFSAKKISDFSHEEVGYKDTKNSDFISYAFAKKLKI